MIHTSPLFDTSGIARPLLRKLKRFTWDKIKHHPTKDLKRYIAVNLKHTISNLRKGKIKERDVENQLNRAT